jgi:hypothetical protein
MNQLSIPRGELKTIGRKGAVAKIDQFHPATKGFRPKTTCRVLHDGKNLQLRFDVRDRYVFCRRRRFQGHVYKDSCVEFFVKPKSRKGYFNFEFNCGGQMLVYYIEDGRWDDEGRMMKYVPLKKTDVETMVITTKLRAPIVPEITRPTDWWLEATIPVSVLEKYVGKIGNLSGQRWRANFQKCANESSHPHWVTWNDIRPAKSFHQPDKFGELVFE